MIHDHVGPLWGTCSVSSLSHDSPFYFVHFSVDLVMVLVATSPSVYLENLYFFPSIVYLEKLKLWVF